MRAPKKHKSLPQSFFKRETTSVARDLLGNILVYGNYQGFIIETEAYRGLDDEASHAFKGATPRAAIMFGPPGLSYVYLIYGIYSCFNVVTEPDGSPGAVLIRGIQLISPHPSRLEGPGKLTRTLGITRKDNGRDLTADPTFYIKEGRSVANFETTSRIGIQKAQEKLWRFVAPVLKL